ncbi:hypothetical protein WH221_04080 [Chryseobacterium culicis]|uniref:C1q domain-containing protein n=1 Tax=Chryseobacterium culicis TaxID=680127 RepID=A0A2S9CY41_CHRCI|nr:hypothetical protein [Chryseobacterium culicis]PRB85437.1 hypothetical protein CQ022_04040 [Chryseobacterium culicis]PRB90843.1 hypothetical protein CQ033_08950 [Chryseobacterium culicis]
MKKNLSTAFAVLFSAFLYSQVGINNKNPKSTFDIMANTTDGSKPEGLITPRLTGDQIRTANNQYGVDQKGAIVYATSADSVPGIKTTNINAEGYYFFDGSVWQKMGSKAYTAGNGLTLSENNVKLGGPLTEATAISNVTTINKLTVTATGTDAINFDSNTLSVDASNDRIGIGTSSPGAKLEIKSGSNGVSGLKFTDFNASSPTGNGQALGVDANGNVITVPNPTTASVSTSEAYLNGNGSYSNVYNVNDLVWTKVPSSNQTISIPAGGKALFLSFMLGIDYVGNLAGSGAGYYTARLFIDDNPTNVFLTTQEPGPDAQTQYSISAVKFLSSGNHAVDVRMQRTFNNGTASGANMNCGVMSMSFNASYIN